MYYCGVNCRIKDWEGFHGHECIILANSHGVSSDEALDSNDKLLLRLYIAIYVKGLGGQPHTTLDGLRITFDDLLPTPFDRLIHQVKVDMKEQFRRLVNLGLHAKDNQLIQLTQKMTNNVYKIVVMNQEVAKGFYVAPAKVFHSCNPNSVYAAVESRLQLRAIKEINSDAEEITVSRVGSLLPLRDRRKEHFKLFDDICTCPRCEGRSDDSSLNEITNKMFRKQVVHFTNRKWKCFFDVGMKRINLTREILSYYNPEVLKLLTTLLKVILTHSSIKKPVIPKVLIEKLARELQDCLRVNHSEETETFKSVISMVSNLKNNREPFVNNQEFE